MKAGAQRAVRATVPGERPAAAVQATARRRGLAGWARAEPAGLRLHVEGPSEAVAELLDELDAEGVEEVRVEGHEQFAVRGVPAGAFVVQEHAASTRHFDLRLEVEGVMRSWALPRGPSLDPAVKRLAVAVADHDVSHNDFEGRLGEGAVIVWDHGAYEQGGRVPWPEALERGHAVFVLHGRKLAGGFALQRTRPSSGGGDAWLLIKRRDEAARPGSDVVAEHPQSVLSGRTLEALLAPAPPAAPRDPEPREGPR